jgi:predicted transposase YdaD
VPLRPAADGPELTGEYDQEFPGRGRNLWFRYDVVRVWEIPPERFLKAGLPLLPLAPVSNVTPEQLPAVLTAVAERLRDEADTGLKTTLWAATEILLGLYYPDERVQDLTREITTMLFGIRGIEESSVYQRILAQGEARGEARGEAKGEARGRVEEAREILIRHGTKKFGPPNEQAKARIASLSDLDRLHDLFDRVLEVANWDELLASADQ